MEKVSSEREKSFDNDIGFLNARAARKLAHFCAFKMLDNKYNKNSDIDLIFKFVNNEFK